MSVKIEIKKGCTLVHILLYCWGIVITIGIYKIVCDINKTTDCSVDNDIISIKEDIKKSIEAGRGIFIRKLKGHDHESLYINLNASRCGERHIEAKRNTRHNPNSSVFIKSLGEGRSQKITKKTLYHFPKTREPPHQINLHNRFEPFQLFEYWHLSRQDFPEWHGDKNLPPWMDKFWEDEI